MVIKISKLKIFLCSLLAISASMTFPLQVYSGNPYPSLIPYVLIGLIFVLNAISFRKIGWSKNSVLPKTTIGKMLHIYLLLVFTQTILQTFFGVISFYESFSVFTIYVFPVLFYSYFRELASEKEIKVFLTTIAFTAFIIGFFFAYESYVKLTQFKLTDFAIKAFEYSFSRSGLSINDVSDARLSLRSFGLLETHSVSSAWIIIGAIASLSLINKENKKLRFTIIIINTFFLILALNFTSILAYSIIIFFIEFNGTLLLRLRVSYDLIIGSVILISLFIIFIISSRYFLGDFMSDFIKNNLIGQIELLFGNSKTTNISYMDIIFNNIKGYINQIFVLPHSLLLGDGFSSFGLKKGGDVGFIESLAKFGVPYFVALLYGFYSLISGGLKKIRSFRVEEFSERNMSLICLKFAVPFMALILITEIHYSVWYSKSILPFFFFSLALFDRYLFNKSL